jgi:hypothetical protein
MLRRILLVIVGVTLVLDALVWVALPEGSRRLVGVVPDGHRVLVTRSVGNVRILLTKDAKKLSLVVAYRKHDRWKTVKVEPAPAASNAAWAATRGFKHVPAFSAVYGSNEGPTVIVRWADGTTNDVPTVQGAYLAVRRGLVRPEGVVLSAAPAP